MNENSHVAIIGAGELGRAISKPLVLKNIPPVFWDTDPSRVPSSASLEAVVSPADYVLLCVPSWAMRAAITGIMPFLRADAVVVSFAKGMEERSLKTMAELLPELLPAGQTFVVVGGPMLAAEISAGKNAAGVFASKNQKALEKIKAVFSSSRFNVEISNDVSGVSLAGVLKNIYAVALGIADGLGMSGNEKGWIVSKAIQEMVAIAAVFMINEKTILGTAGVADLIATGYSEYSRNREVGAEIVKNGICNLKGEGLISLPFLIKRLGEKAAAFPLLILVQEVGIACKPAAPAFEAFFEKTF